MGRLFLLEVSIFPNYFRYCVCNLFYFLPVSAVFNVVPKKPMKPMFSSAMSSNSYLAIDNGRITGMVINVVLSFLR